MTPAEIHACGEGWPRPRFEPGPSQRRRRICMGGRGDVAEQRVYEALRTLPSVVHVRRANCAEDKGGCDLVATLACGHTMLVQVKAGAPKRVEYYRSRGIHLMRRVMERKPCELRDALRPFVIGRGCEGGAS